MRYIYIKFVLKFSWFTILYSFLLYSKVIQCTLFSIFSSMMVYDRCWTEFPALHSRTLFIHSMCNKNSVHFWSFEVLQRPFPPESSMLFHFILFHPIPPTLSEDLLCANPCVCLPVFLSPPQWESIEGSWWVRTKLLSLQVLSHPATPWPWLPTKVRPLLGSLRTQLCPVVHTFWPVSVCTCASLGR